MMNDPHWLVQELAGQATWQVMVAIALGAGWALKNRQKIIDKLGLPKQPKTIRKTVGDSLSPTDTVSAEVKAIWNTHARVVSERQALWNVEAGSRLIDRTLETASWVLPDLLRHLLR